MDWYDDQAFQDEVKPSTDRVLTSISGNAQPFSLGPRHEGDEHNALSLDAPDHSSCRYSAATTTLCSNDRRAYIRKRFNSRRLRQRIRLAQTYLQHPKFLAFKGRPRKDICQKTGETIWDEETERAFHNAIINIPAMGRRKKSQKGKSLGRNELIVEWIKQETDRHRTRKQISSHIQTLDNLFKPRPEDNFAGVDEWSQIRKEFDDPTDSDGPEFYDNSIADMVRNWRLLQVDLTQIDLDIDATLPSATKIGIAYLEPDTLGNLHFEMWVSLSDQMDKALHRYTTVQSNISTGIPEPLENIPGWRTSWPGLASLIENVSDDQKFDIILLNASIRLMLDFPPARSKLGIGLELDFNAVDEQPILANSTCWYCTTHIYQQGQLEAKIDHTGCHTSGPGRVKPPFESKWWAEQFTRLTEKRRHAMDSGNDAAIEAADEAARQYLSNLKIMQLISKETVTALLPKDSQIGADVLPKRMAVLLWSFSRTSSYFVGTTTWHKLIPPPQRPVMNSPVPAQDLVLSSLNMNPTIDAAFDKSHFVHQGTFSPYSFQSMIPLEKQRPRDEVRSDNFVLSSEQNFAPVALQYDPASGCAGSTFEYHDQRAYNFNMQHLTQQNFANANINFDNSNQNVLADDPFDSNQNLQYSHGLPVIPSQRGYHRKTDVEIGLEQQQAQQAQQARYTQIHNMLRKQSLMAFDTNTHKMLQEKLSYDHRHVHSAPPMQHSHQGKHEDRPSNLLLSQTKTTAINPEDESLRQALIAETYHDTDSQTDGHILQADHRLQSYQPADSPIPAPTAIYPSLQHRHSFAGVLNNNVLDDTDATAGIDASRHQSYLHLFNNLGSADDKFLDVDPLLAMHDQSMGMSMSMNHVPADLGMDRSNSEPLPTVTLVEDPDGIGEGDFGIGGSEVIQNSDLRVPADDGFSDGEGDDKVGLAGGNGEGGVEGVGDDGDWDRRLEGRVQGEVEGEWVKVKIEPEPESEGFTEGV